MEHDDRRPRGLQIRLVSGNACIIGTPTPSTTGVASGGQVIMNRGSDESRGCPVRLHLLGAQQTRAEVRENASGSSAYTYTVHACMRRIRPPPEQSASEKVSASRLIDELYRTFAQLSPPPLGMVFGWLESRGRRKKTLRRVDREEGQRENVHPFTRACTRSCLPIRGCITSAITE